MRWVVLGCVLAGCGRIAFDPRSEVSDVIGIPAECARNTTAPDPLTVTGTTFRYMSFDNSTRTLLPGVTVTAVDVATAAELANTTSNSLGEYTLSVPTGGVPRAVGLTYALASHFETTLTLDRMLERNIGGAGMPVWTVGDGPLWNLAGMNQFYMAAGMLRNATKGTLNIAVRDCAGQPIEGVTIAVSPPPALLRYQGDDGMLVAGNSTLDRFATAFGFNAEPGTTTITASGGGYQFAPVTVVVNPDQFNTLAILHADP